MANQLTEYTVKDALKLLDCLFPQDSGELIRTEAGRKILSFKRELFRLSLRKVDIGSTTDVDSLAYLTREEVEVILTGMCELRF